MEKYSTSFFLIILVTLAFPFLGLAQTILEDPSLFDSAHTTQKITGLPFRPMGVLLLSPLFALNQFFSNPFSGLILLSLSVFYLSILGLLHAIFFLHLPQKARKFAASIFWGSFTLSLLLLGLTYFFYSAIYFTAPFYIFAVFLTIFLFFGYLAFFFAGLFLVIQQYLLKKRSMASLPIALIMSAIIFLAAVVSIGFLLALRPDGFVETDRVASWLGWTYQNLDTALSFLTNE